jgi:hypothetical protein
MRFQSARSRDQRIPQRDRELRGGDERVALATRGGVPMSSRIPRVVVTSLAAAILALSVTQVAFGAAAVTTTWQAKVGASGANGTASLATVTPSVGSIGLKLVKFKASSTLPVTLYKGTCSSVGPVLFRLSSITTTKTGAASRTSTLTAAQVKLILGATAGTGKIAIRVGSGTATKCGAFAKHTVLGPQAVVQAFYKYYLVDSAYPDLVGRPDVAPSFIQWLKTWTQDVNPIVCAQGGPDSVQAGAAAVSSSSASVTTTEVWNGIASPTGSGPKVTLALAPTGWQISAIDCGFPPLP